MEYSNDNLSEEMKNDIKLEDTKFKDMGKPDYIDTKEDITLGEIKQEELLIKPEVEDSWEDNT